MHNEPLAELEARKLFPEAIQAYLTPVQPLYDADFSWKYNGPFPSPETMANASLFSGEYFRLNDDCFDMRPGYGVAQPGSFWLKLYGFRWCTLLLSVVAIVYVLAPRIHILDKGQMALNIIFLFRCLKV